MRAALAAALFLAAAAYAGPPSITIPPEIRATGDYVTLSPETTAKAISYVAPFAPVARVVLVILAVLVIIGMLVGLVTGRPLIVVR